MGVTFYALVASITNNYVIFNWKFRCTSNNNVCASDSVSKIWVFFLIKLNVNVSSDVSDSFEKDFLIFSTLCYCRRHCQRIVVPYGPSQWNEIDEINVTLPEDSGTFGFRTKKKIDKRFVHENENKTTKHCIGLIAVYPSTQSQPQTKHTISFICVTPQSAQSPSQRAIVRERE